MLPPTQHKSTKVFIQKYITTGHTFIAPENLSGFSKPAVRKGKRT
jgi:hypothetical protein